MLQQPELLAPAGSLETLKYAVMYGADAVYCALPEFGMRAAPVNLTVGELHEGCIFAHARGNNDILAFQAGGLFKHGPVRGIVKNKLQDACGVPQVRKNNAALVAAFCDGAGHRHLCARVPGAQRPAIVGTAQVSHCFHKNHPFRRFASAQIQEQTPAPATRSKTGGAFGKGHAIQRRGGLYL